MQLWKPIFILTALMFCLGCGGSQATQSANSVETNNSPSVQPSNTAPSSNETSAVNQPQKIIYILDASGSMLGKVGAEEKMAAARRVLKDSIAKLSNESHVGLIAYGHRRKNDCADIELLSSLKLVDKTALAQQVDALKPSGMTPITNSLQQAFDAVRAQQSRDAITVVLVTDGLETCPGDPCKLAREAKQAGLNFVLHVIGFDVGKVKVSQLECVAQAGGGVYLGAQNAEELGTALAGAVAPPAVGDGRLSVKAIADGKLTDVVVHVRRTGTNDEVTGGRTYDAPDTNPRILPLAAGDYDVTVTAVNLSGAPSLRFEKVAIGSGQTVEKTADFSAGELAIEVIRNGKPSEAVVQVFATGKTDAAATGRTGPGNNPFIFRVLPGKYEIAVKSIEVAGGATMRLTDVSVEGAKQTKRTVDFTTGTLRIGAVRGNELIDAVVTIVLADTGKNVKSARTYATANTNPRTFELPPGRYRVKLAAVKPPGLTPQEVIIEIKPGETLERKIEF